MYYTHLRHIDPEQNKYRFYSIRVTKTLFGEWAVMREWGRIGRAGRVKTDYALSKTDAITLEQRLKGRKISKGYDYKY